MEQQMVRGRHETVTGNFESIYLSGFLKNDKEKWIVIGREEYLLPSPAPVHNVTPGSWIFYVWWSGTLFLCHTFPAKVKRSFDPFFFSIMGSGEQTTRLNGAVSTNTNDAGSSLVSGANNTTLSDLTVENIVVGNLSSIAIYNNNCSPKIINVSTITSGGGSAIGVFNTSSSSPTMTNVSVTVSGTSTTTGVLNDSSSPVIDNVTVTVTGGTASTCGVTNQNASAPTIKNLAVTTSGGVGNHVGILNDYSSPTMNNVNVTIMGTDSNIGISNIRSSPIMINVNAEALGGTDAIGVKSRDSLPMMTYVIANASGGSNTNIGYLSPFNMDGSYLGIAKFRHCVFKGITYGLYTDALHDYIFISQSSIIGGLYFGVATINCLNSDNGELQEFGLDCIEKDIEP